MKKIILGLLAVAALTACDPSLEKNSWSGEKMSADQLANGIAITQYGGGKEGSSGVAQAGGNWIEFSTNPSKVVRVYYIKKDGSESDLSVGSATGLFYLRPSRGSDSNQTLYFETLEFDGTSVTAQKQITVDVAQELTTEMAIICSNKGEKTWKWDNRDGGAFWGNFGYTPGSGDDFADNRSGQWWGVTCTADFANQQQHRGSDTVKGDDDTDATMIFSEDGTVKCYDKDGKEIRKGSFEIKNYSPDNKKVINDQAWSVGQLVTSAGSILWPYQINASSHDGVYQPTEFEIVRLTSDQLILTYASPGTGSWSEATFWRFYSDTDAEGAIAGYKSTGKDWTWDTQIGTFWGNAGYNAGGDWSTANQGQWWGITCTEDFASQQQHRGSDKVTGDDDTNAWMTFYPDGSVKCFNAAGTEIRSGSWAVDMTPTTANNIGTFSTSAGSILWPYQINATSHDGVYQPTDFELMYLSPSKIALVYAAPGTGDWSECTFWRFMKK